MHDANGTPLRKGDRVFIPGIITGLSADEEFCNVNVRTELGRRPDGRFDTFCALNTGQLVKFRNADPDPPVSEDVYFDPRSGMRPADLEVNLDLQRPELSPA